MMIIGAAIAIGSTDLICAIVALGVVGLGISLIFLLLQAPDLAILQLVVEIMSLVIMIRAFGMKDTVNIRERRFIATSISVILMGFFLVFSMAAIFEIPRFGSPLMKTSLFYLRNGFRQTGVPNMVSAIILDYRSLDMLGQVVIAFSAAIGLVLIGRKKIHASTANRAEREQK